MLVIQLSRNDENVAKSLSLYRTMSDRLVVRSIYHESYSNSNSKLAHNRRASWIFSVYLASRSAEILSDIVTYIV